jgi:hypothetical protein
MHACSLLNGESSRHVVADRIEASAHNPRGGNLHDARQAPEIAEVVLGELQEGRAALMERVTLRVSVPANLRAEVVGAWAHAAVPGMLQVMVGSLLPDQTKRVVFRLHCPSGAPGTTILLGVSAERMRKETR